MMKSDDPLLDGKTQNKELSWLLWKVSIVASLGGLLFGFDTAVISGTFGMVKDQYGLSNIQVGWFGSSALVGAIAGALISGRLSDLYGRKPLLILASILFFMSALFSAFPPDFFWLIGARLLGGIGVGMASVLSPMYISEFAPAHKRGRLVALYQFSIVVGILLAYFSNWLIINSMSKMPIYPSDVWNQLFAGEAWRGMFAAEMIPSGLFILLLLFVPESPRWLIEKSQRKNENYWSIIQRIDRFADRKHLIKKSKRDVSKRGINYLLNPVWRKPLVVGIGLSVFGQFTGINIVIYYGPTILGGAGYELDSAIQFQVLIGLINLIFTTIALFKIDSWGRRPLLLGGMISVVISLCGLGMLFSKDLANGIWSVVILCIYIASLALSINAVIWVLIGEIYPTHIRGEGVSIATFANWVINFATAFLFPWYIELVGLANGFYTFAAISFLGLLFFYNFIPETKGMSLEEIEEYWNEIS